MFYKKIRLSIVLIFLTGLSGCQTIKTLLQVNEQDVDTTSISEQEKLKPTETVNELLSTAREAWSADQKDKAQVYYIKAFEMDPTNVDILEEMADIYNQLNNDDLVEVCYQLILKEQPENIEIQEDYGLLLIKQKKMTEARQLLKNVVENKQSWKAYNGLGIIFDMQGEYKQALTYFNKARTIQPNNPDILNNIGYSLYMEQAFLEAQRFFLKALKIDHKFEKAIYNYALTLARQKKYADALSTFTKVIDLPEANNNIGYIAMNNGDLKMARYYLRQAINLSPHYYLKAQQNLDELRVLIKQNDNK